MSRWHCQFMRPCAELSPALAAAVEPGKLLGPFPGLMHHLKQSRLWCAPNSAYIMSSDAWAALCMRYLVLCHMQDSE